jgi:DUF3017 family protein
MRHAAPGPARPGRKDGGRRRAAQPQQHVRWEQVPYGLAVAGAVAGLVTMRLGTQDLKSGTFVLAGVLLVAALARLVLPDRRAGLLSSRRRLFDVAMFAVFGIGLLVAGLGVLAPAG